MMETIIEAVITFIIGLPLIVLTSRIITAIERRRQTLKMSRETHDKH